MCEEAGESQTFFRAAFLKPILRDPQTVNIFLLPQFPGSWERVKPCTVWRSPRIDVRNTALERYCAEIQLELSITDAITIPLLSCTPTVPSQ